MSTADAPGHDPFAPIRHTIDTLSSDALDALYDRLEHAETELRRYTEADSADAAAGSYALRAERAEAAIERVRHLADLLHAGVPWTSNHHNLANRIRAALDEPNGPPTAEQPARTTPNNSPTSSDSPDDPDGTRRCESLSWTDKLRCIHSAGHPGEHVNQLAVDINQVRWIDDPEPADAYEQTTGHEVTCGAGFGMGCQCGTDATAVLDRLRTRLTAELAKARRCDEDAAGRTDLPDLRVSPHSGIAAGLEIALFLLGHHLREVGEVQAPAQCTGEEGFCPEHGFHRHPPTRLEAREKTIREHTLNLHVIGEQLSEIESWFWAHLADVREAARQELGGPLPDDVQPAHPQDAPSGSEGAPDGSGGSGQPAGRPRAVQADTGGGDGPSVGECRDVDRNWDVEKAGE